MNSRRKKGLSGVLALLWISHAGAYGSVPGHVIQVRVDKQGQGMVVFDAQVTPVGSPLSCVIPAYANAFSFDANTPGGKSVLATALATKATGAMVDAYGTGACTIYGNNYIEDWSYGVIH